MSDIEGEWNSLQVVIPVVWIVRTVLGKKGFDSARRTFSWLIVWEAWEITICFVPNNSHSSTLIWKIHKNNSDFKSLYFIFPLMERFQKNLNLAFSLTICLLCHLLSRVRLFCDPMDHSPTRLLCPWISQARILEWVAISLLQGIFSIHGSNLHLPPSLGSPFHEG